LHYATQLALWVTYSVLKDQVQSQILRCKYKYLNTAHVQEPHTAILVGEQITAVFVNYLWPQKRMAVTIYILYLINFIVIYLTANCCTLTCFIFFLSIAFDICYGCQAASFDGLTPFWPPALHG